jgi:RNA polymerase sigma-70 factor, ECF subfamily
VADEPTEGAGGWSPDEIRQGGRAAVERLLAEHRDYLRRLADYGLDGRLRGRVDPSDVVQEAQLEAVRRLDEYLSRPTLPVRLWLRQLLLDRLGMLRRRHLGSARRAVDREVGLPDRSSFLARQLAGSVSSPSARVRREEDVERVRRAVERLADADRELLHLRTFEGLSFPEIALLLGIEPAAARKRHGRALLRLNVLLAADEGGSPS